MGSDSPPSPWPLIGLVVSYLCFEKFGQPLWATRWRLYLATEAGTHLVLAFFVLWLLEGIRKVMLVEIWITLVPDIDHVIWAGYRNYFHTPIFVFSPLFFYFFAPRDARLWVFMFATHYLFDSRSQMAWWLGYGVWLLPPKGIPVLAPWAPISLLVLLGLSALWIGHLEWLRAFLRGEVLS